MLSMMKGMSVLCDVQDEETDSVISMMRAVSARNRVREPVSTRARSTVKAVRTEARTGGLIGGMVKWRDEEGSTGSNTK